MCNPRLSDPLVSSVHASLTWRDDAWYARDLNSRNGTTVNGDRLGPNEERTLRVGDRLGVGNLHFTLVDGAGPEPTARRLPGEVTVPASGGVLAIPEEARPSLTVWQDAEGRWVAERDGEEEEVFDGDVVTVEGEAWMLHLPQSHVATQEARAAAVHFTFAVTPDEEDVEIRLMIGGNERVLRARSHYYTLLTMARARLSDEAKNKRGGWRSVSELCQALRCDENKLNVDIFRCRQELGRVGVTGAANVIERKRATRELRFRPDAVRVVPWER